MPERRGRSFSAVLLHWLDSVESVSTGEPHKEAWTWVQVLVGLCDQREKMLVLLQVHARAQPRDTLHARLNDVACHATECRGVSRIDVAYPVACTKATAMCAMLVRHASEQIATQRSRDRSSTTRLHHV